MLTLLNVANYLDRQVLPATLEDIKVGLSLSDKQMGLLGTSFLLVIIAASPVFGVLGDRQSRTRLVAVGAAVWSLATVASGLAASFGQLLVARMLVGSGEAAYGTIAPSLLSDLFAPRLRGRVFAIFYAALPVGAALGFTLGGAIDRHYGWRYAFWLTGLPGLLLALWSSMAPDPPRGALDAQPPAEVQSASPYSAPEAQSAPLHSAPEAQSAPLHSAPEAQSASGGDESPTPSSAVQIYRQLWANSHYLQAVLGYAMQTFAVGGLAFWAPAFLARVRGMERTDAAIEFGVVVALGGFVGSLAGGWLADAGLRHSRNAYLWLSGGSTLVAVPFCLGALCLPSHRAFMSCIFVAVTLLFMSTGPINALLVTLVEPGMRASAVAVATVAIHLIGDAPANAGIGWLSDAVATHLQASGVAAQRAEQLSLGYAVLVLPLAVLLAAVIWLAAARRLDSSEPTPASYGGL
jgi:MFS transporter, Spinster family, sphingosine-1-phosphate transporter